jgi:AhpD family alkylhydroperoxidase
MRNPIVSTGAVLLLALLPTQIVRGQEAPQGVPQWMKDTFPQQGLKSAWEEHQVLSSDGALDAKTKHLIALGVSAQIPCDYCIYFHTQAAKHAGATEAQLKEAIAAAALTRKWSAVLNGANYDMQKFRQQVDASFARN